MKRSSMRSSGVTSGLLPPVSCACFKPGVPTVGCRSRRSGDDDLVTEDLAEIYLAQGLYDEAIAIYRKLSLLNPEKSVYFASLIDKIANK